MTSEDEDPEARIAGLERSLSASAAHVETPPTAIRSGLRLGWVLLAVLVTGLVISGGVMLVDHRTRTVAGWPTGEQTPRLSRRHPKSPPRRRRRVQRLPPGSRSPFPAWVATGRWHAPTATS